MNYMKAVEYDKLPSKFRKASPLEEIRNSDNYVAQPKYDGVYCQISLPDGAVLSRTDEVLHSVPHCVEALRKFIPPGYVVVAEIWHPTWDHSQINGAARRHKPQGDLVCVVHDIIPQSRETPEPYISRYTTLMRLFHWNGTVERPGLLLAESRNACFGAKIKDGLLDAPGAYDGVMYKAKYEGYTPGLVKRGELIKDKFKLSLDLRVTGCDIRNGEKTGRPVYVLHVEYRGVTTQVGSGVPHTLDPEAVIGKIVEVESLGVFKSGLLREPRFKAFRFDKEEPDT